MHMHACSLGELSECHTEIANNAEFLDQLTCLSTCPSFDFALSSQLVATVFLCLAYTQSTHPFLTKPLLIRRLLDTHANKFPDMTRLVLISYNCHTHMHVHVPDTIIIAQLLYHNAVG